MSNDLNMLLHIDALFDLRMGTLIDLCPDIHKHVNSETYHNRNMDNFEEITGGAVTNEAFIARYEKRDIDILKKSIITGIVPIINTYLSGLGERLTKRIDVGDVTVDLNIAPFVLPGPILEEVVAALYLVLPEYVHVRSVRYDLSELTPEFVGRHYNGWCLYDFQKWLEIHHERLLVHPINQVSCIIPRIFSKDPGEFETDHEFLRDADKHSLFEMLMEDFIHIESLEVSDFSFMVPGLYRKPD